jgi:DNA-binding NarL/FixJ family response regulator
MSPRAPDHPSARVRPPLVGRSREQARLRRTLDELLAGHGSTVLVSGEAGIGKTTLVEWLAAEAQRRECLVLRGACYDLSVTPPYGPWISAMHDYRDGSDAPTLSSLLIDPTAHSAVESQNALFARIMEFCTRVASRQPTVVLLEDLHWADQSSIDLLRYIARQLGTHPLLVLATHRADELHLQHPLTITIPLLVREADAERIELRPLTAAGNQALIQSRYKLSQADQTRLEQYLETRAEGNPLYAGELLRTLEEQNILHSEGDTLRLGDLTKVIVPTLLRQLIAGRLVRLGERVSLLLSQAAVIGHDVPLDLWAALSGVSEDDLLIVLERAIDARVLDPTDRGVRFAHALIRDAIYDSVLPIRRRAWHQQIAETLLVRSSPDPDRIAYHLQQAGDERASGWLIRAGERAQRAYAYVAAGDRFEAALAILDRTDTTVGERGWLLWRIARMRRFSDLPRSIAHLDEALACARDARDHILLGNALLDRGMILPQLGRVRLGLRDMEASVDTLKTLTSADQLRVRDFAPILEVADEIVAEANVIPYLSVAGRFIEARTRGEYVIDAMSSTSSPHADQRSILSEAYFGVARAYGALGFAEQARSAFERAGEFYAATGHHMAHGVTLLTELDQTLIPFYADHLSERRRIVAAAETAFAKATTAAPDQPLRIAGVPLLMLQGDWAAARQELDAMPRQLEPFPVVLRATIAVRQGDVELARQLVRETLPDGPETPPGDSDFVQFNRMQHVAATLALDTGDLLAAREWITAYDGWLAWSKTVLGHSDGQLLWAQFYRKAGKPAEASTYAQRASTTASAPRQPLALLAAQRFLGEHATDSGQYDYAAFHLDESLRLADACAAPFERALTLVALAELRLTQRRIDEASAHLDEVQAICARLDAKPTLQRAETLRQKLNALGQPVPTYPSGLTQREVEVLQHIAAGHSNRQIADALFLSPRTVERHIANVYLKIDVHSKSEATVFALQYHLV